VAKNKSAKNEIVSILHSIISSIAALRCDWCGLIVRPQTVRTSQSVPRFCRMGATRVCWLRNID